MHDALLYVFGAVGGLIYSFPVYLAALSRVPPARFALAVLVFSIFVGAVIAPAVVPFVGHWPWAAFLVSPEPYPLAVGVGLLANRLVPVFIRKVTGWAETSDWSIKP